VSQFAVTGSAQILCSRQQNAGTLSPTRKRKLRGIFGATSHSGAAAKLVDVHYTAEVQKQLSASMYHVGVNVAAFRYHQTYIHFNTTVLRQNPPCFSHLNKLALQSHKFWQALTTPTLHTGSTE